VGVPSETRFEIVQLDRLDPSTAAAIARIVERARVHDGRSPIGEHKFIRLVGGEADTFGLIGRVDGICAGFAQATRYAAHDALPSRLAAELLVDPEHRGSGLGRALVTRLLTHARRHEVARFDIWAHHADGAATGLATAMAMRVSRQLWQMAMRLDPAAAEQRLELPDGVRLRAFRPGVDEGVLIGLIREAFSGHPENAVFDAEDLAARADLPWFDPSAILIAEDVTSSKPLGVHWMKLDAARHAGKTGHAGEGASGHADEVYILAVAPEAQGRGIGHLRLSAGLQPLRDRGTEMAILSVDAENQAAIALYRKAGFRFEHLDTCYSLDLRE
jgi:mycothiol synthase